MLVTSFNQYKNTFLPKAITDAIEEAMPLFKDTLPEDGVYDLQNDAKAFVMRYDTKSFDEVAYESHKIMTDIQIILEGEEYIYATDSAKLTINTENYERNKKSDLYFYKEKAQEYSRAYLTKGSFAVIYPPTAHAPAIMVNNPSPIVKMVIKIPLG